MADHIAEWKKQPGAVDIRVIVTKEPGRNPSDKGLDRVLREAVRHDFPVNILCWGNLDAGTALIDRHRDVRFIIDHLGIMQPAHAARPAAALGGPDDYEQAVEPFRRTDRLSEHERAMLMGGACAKAYGWAPKKGSR